MTDLSTSARLPWPGHLPPPPPPPSFIPPPPPPVSAPPPPPADSIFAEGPVRLPERSSEIRWRWKHLWAFGSLAFGLPAGLANAFAPQERVSEFLDGALYFQLLGYVLAALLAVHMVRSQQAGDWSSLGLEWRGNILREVATGGAFGLLLLGAYMPIAYLIAGGEFEFDQLIKVLVGSTNGLGLALAAVVVVIGAPVIEEIYFRGLLYEKLARRSVKVAIVVTALLFTAAHGALLIPGILMMGLALAWQRRRRSLWYTMGAHAAWNLTVTVIAAFVLLGGSSYSPADGAYTIELPKAWERIDTTGFDSPPGTSMDIALQSATGSMISITRIPAVEGSAEATLERVRRDIERHAPPGMYVAPIQGHDHLFDAGSESFHLSLGIDQGAVQTASHFFVMLKPGESKALLFNITCLREVCVDDGRKIDDAMHGLTFGP